MASTTFVMEDQCAIVILAAGSSSRLGKPKQMLLFQDSTLLQHSINVSLASLAEVVIVVLGANAGTLQPGISNHKLTYIVNDHWQEGIASSIRCGVNYLLAQTAVKQNIIFTACDQPFITTGLLDKLITLQKEGSHTIVASNYASAIGIPAIFNRQMFPELLQLKGDAGAKKLIMQQKDMATVSFPLGEIDIDTAADYANLQKKLTTNNDH